MCVHGAQTKDVGARIEINTHSCIIKLCIYMKVYCMYMLLVSGLGEEAYPWYMYMYIGQPKGQCF